MKSRFKRATHILLELSAPGDLVGRIFDHFMTALIMANVVAIILQSVEQYAATYKAYFEAFDVFSVGIFVVEYVLRLWSCTSNHDPRFHHPVLGRLRYAATPLVIIDLMAFGPYFLGILFGADAKLLLFLELLRTLKLARYFSALGIIGSVLRQQYRALSGALVILLTALVLLATLMYVMEHDVQPQVFPDIPHAMWWAIVTLTTVGYGDYVPVTLAGRLIAGATMITGIMMLALPTGVIVTGFASEISKRNFVVNWKLVSNVPLFSKLDASQVGEIVSLLTPLVVPANQAVVRLGEPAESMFFIVSGRVEVEMPPEPVFLESGDFFGEMAIIESRRRGASVVALTECNLLELKADDFRRLLAAHPGIRESVDEVISARRRQFAATSTSERV